MQQTYPLPVSPPQFGYGGGFGGAGFGGGGFGGGGFGGGGGWGHGHGHRRIIHERLQELQDQQLQLKNELKQLQVQDKKQSSDELKPPPATTQSLPAQPLPSVTEIYRHATPPLSSSPVIQSQPAVSVIHVPHATQQTPQILLLSSPPQDRNPSPTPEKSAAFPAYMEQQPRSQWRRLSVPLPGQTSAAFPEINFDEVPLFAHPEEPHAEPPAQAVTSPPLTRTMYPQEYQQNFARRHTEYAPPPPEPMRRSPSPHAFYYDDPNPPPQFLDPRRGRSPRYYHHEEGDYPIHHRSPRNYPPTGDSYGLVAPSELKVPSPRYPDDYGMQYPDDNMARRAPSPTFRHGRHHTWTPHWGRPRSPVNTYFGNSGEPGAGTPPPPPL